MQTNDELIEKKARTVMKLITDIKLIPVINDEERLFCADPEIFIDVAECLDVYKEATRTYIQPDNNSYIPILEKIISLGFDINQAGCFGQTLLHFFVWNLEAVNFLLERGANVNARDTYGDTPLQIYIDSFKQLLPLPKHDGEIRDNDRAKFEHDAKVIVSLFADYGYDFSIPNDAGENLIDSLRQQCDFAKSSNTEVEIVYFITQKTSPPGKHFEVFCKIIDDIAVVADFYQNKHLSFSDNLTASSLEETDSIWEAMDFFKRLSPEESLRQRLGLCVYILKHDKFPLYFKETNFEPLKALFMIVFPQKLLDMVKLILKDFDINYRFQKGNLLHLMLELECYDVAVWLIENHIDINAKDSAGLSVIEWILRDVFVVYNDKHHLVQDIAFMLLKNEKLDCSVTTSFGTNLFQLVWNMIIHIKEYIDYRIMVLLVSRMYKNPMDLLTDCFSDHPLYTQQIIMPNPNAPFVYNAKTFTPPRKKAANTGSRQATAMQLFVKRGMQLNQTLSSLSRDEQLSVVAYRYISLVTNTYTRTKHSFETEDFQLFYTEDYPLMQLYHSKALATLGNFSIYEVLKKILEIKFTVNAKGALGQTLLHYVIMSLDIKALQLLLESGANPNIEDCYGETPLFKLVHLLHNNLIDDAFFNSVILLRKFNADFQTCNNYGESLLDTALQMIASIDGNIDKLLRFVALIAVQCVKDPIIFLDNYCFDEEERSHLYQSIYYFQKHFPYKDLTVKTNPEKEDDEHTTKKPRLSYSFFKMQESDSKREKQAESTPEFIQSKNSFEMDC